MSIPPKPESAASGRNVVAVLGPTNTGKTHLAIERMLAHPSGVIGLPLRLLAREVYNRVAERAGADQVALVTGEEKILPPAPRFTVCTVEAMPAETSASFLAIDEIQLAGDLERGHVFTDRILNLRGRDETLLLGAATMRGIVEKLIPGVNVVTRPRMSMLTWAGSHKITRLPQRSAIVAFSADEVYAIAELIRRQRGGAAVVLGSLSPRTRNAQVEIFQSGDVDFLVATDAIGMGLNLDVNHVAFASDRKFDGYQYRRLSAAELGQIAGRAGRHMRDGTFGVTGRAEPFEDALVEALESHRFDAVRTVQWRNRDLDFSSLDALRASLDRAPERDGLAKAPPSIDVDTLAVAARDDEIVRLVDTPRRVALLWEVCQIPDYRRIAPANHAELVTTLFTFLARDGVIQDDWFDRQVSQTDRTDGDIDTLANRIAHIRTWTFAANRQQWLRDPLHWQERTRAIEDRLSDALHERLTARFIDRRTSVLMRRLKENAMLEAGIDATGDVLVEGQHVGRLEGFRFTLDPNADGPEAKALRAAAQKALAGALADRAERVANAPNTDFVLATDGALRWQGAAIARLAAGDDALKPRFILLADDMLAAPARERIQARIDLWLANHVAQHIKPLLDLRAAETLAGNARGIAYRLSESLGVIERSDIADEIKALEQDARAGLRALGVRFGAYHIYVPALLKPAPAGLLATLWALKHGGLDAESGLQELSRLAASGRTTVPVDPAIPRDLYRVVGYRPSGTRAVRIDILERLADLIRPLIAWRPRPEQPDPPDGAIHGYGFTVTVAMTSLLGCSGEDFAAVLRSLGYRVDRRPKPPAPAKADAATEAAATEATAGETPASPEDEAAPAEAVAAEAPETPAASEPAAPEPAALEPAAPAPTAEEPAAPISPDPGSAAPELVAPESVTSESVAPESATEEAATSEVPAAAAPEEPQFIEIWRPGRAVREGQPQNHQPRHQHRRPQRHQHARDQAGPLAAAAVEGAAPAEAAAPAREQEARPPRPPRDKDRRRDKNHHRRPERDGHDNGRRPRRDEPPQRFTTERPKRERVADPNSPFAALAALKAELEAKKPSE